MYSWAEAGMLAASTARDANMKVDTKRLDETVLALLYLGCHEEYRAWKGFDWEVLGRLHEKGYISSPVNKAKSVVFTAEGRRESERLFRTLFCE